MNRFYLSKNVISKIIARNSSVVGLESTSHCQNLDLTVTNCRHLTSDLYPKLSRQQVSWYLRYHEYYSGEINDGVLKSFTTNKLASNNPIEDRAAEVRLVHSDGRKNEYLFGVFDGHGGCACAQILSERLFSYVALMLSSNDLLRKIQLEKIDPCRDLIYRFTHKDYYHSQDMEHLYRVALQRLARDLLSAPNDDSTVEDIFKAAFLRLDHDILADALPKEGHGDINIENLSLALTGSCANLAYITGTDVYVANTGDCKAVIGHQIGQDEWIPIMLSYEHDAENEKEVTRICSAHPGESDTVLRNGRLLGDLAPLRAFGDARYKWPSAVMKHALNIFSPNGISIYGESLIPHNYKTPPYLTAEPEVVHHALSARDKFMVIGSDGLWELLKPNQVVDLIAAHMDDRQIISQFVVPQSGITLKEINDVLKVRKRILAKKPEDENVATHVLRMALGPDHTQLSQYLTIPPNIVRNYRDDITITVVYFDTDYIAERNE
ncbi:hypothetical protein DPMN_070461 [Dreissena polymorpha]|uniref:PPM-type phosphatase domain-containing protein n=2 Tax=Dreissena polymorpha TaxID=45954 RepID=A0A9D3Z0T7_DREPO|nr:hypothetical protein DPMN_070461 [Dreissena polymorpha]